MGRIITTILTVVSISSFLSSSYASDCEQDYYRDKGSGRCMACVSCLGDTVETRPCGPILPRQCRCKDGMRCDTPVSNTCARCTKKDPDPDPAPAPAPAPAPTPAPPPQPQPGDDSQHHTPSDNVGKCCNTDDGHKMCYY